MRTHAAGVDVHNQGVLRRGGAGRRGEAPRGRGALGPRGHLRRFSRAGKKTKKAKNGKANGTVGRRNERATAGVELVAFNLVASAFSRANEPRRAEAILRAMLDDPHGDGVVPKPDRATFNTVIDAYAAIARPKRSTESQIAQPTRSQLNEDSNTELNGDGFDDRYDDRYDDDSEDACDAASRLLREMRSPKVRLEPCLKTWTSVLSACARAGAPDRAREVFDRMRAAGVTPDAKAWTALMQAHASAGDLHATADAYWRMRTEGVAPNEGTLGAALAAGRVGGGDVGALIAIYRDMRALDVRPNNRGFRQLTEMWVDQAFEPPSGGVSSGSVQSSDPVTSFTPTSCWRTSWVPRWTDPRSPSRRTNPPSSPETLPICPTLCPTLR